MSTIPRSACRGACFDRGVWPERIWLAGPAANVHHGLSAAVGQADSAGLAHGAALAAGVAVNYPVPRSQADDDTLRISCHCIQPALLHCSAPDSRGLPSALAPQRRYVLHLALTFNNLLLIALSFWTFWSLREVAWTFRGFTAALLIPGLLYHGAAALIPENPENVLSWRDHFVAVRRPLVGGSPSGGLLQASALPSSWECHSSAAR